MFLLATHKTGNQEVIWYAGSQEAAEQTAKMLANDTWQYSPATITSAMLLLSGEIVATFEGGFTQTFRPLTSADKHDLVTDIESVLVVESAIQDMVEMGMAGNIERFWPEQYLSQMMV